MRLNDSDLQMLAARIATVVQPSLEEIEVVKAAVPKSVVERETVRRPLREEVVVDRGPGRATWVVMAFGALGTVFVGLALGGLALLLSASVAGLITFVVSRKTRRMESVSRETGKWEEYEEEHFQEVTGDSTVETQLRVLPSTKKVIGVGKVTLNFFGVPVGDGVLILDAEGVSQSVDLEFTEPKDHGSIRRAIKKLRETTETIPPVLGRETGSVPFPEDIGAGKDVVLRGEELKTYRGLQTLAKKLEDQDSSVFRLWLVKEGDPLISLMMPKKGQGAVTDRILDGIALAEKLLSLNGKPFDRFLEETERTLSMRQLVIHGVRFASLPVGLSPICQTLGEMFHFSAFNFYCPSCNSEVVKDLLSRDYSVQADEDHDPIRYSTNTRCFYDPQSGVWRCRSCESRTTHPIPLHKVLDEVLLPAFDLLMDENKNQRIAVYSDARTREMGSENEMQREVEGLFQRNRGSLERLQYELRMCDAEISGEEAAIESFDAVMQAYDLKQSSAMVGIGKRYGETMAVIEEHRRKTNLELDELFDRETERALQDLQGCSRASYLEQEKRDAVLISVAESNLHILDETQKVSEQVKRGADAQERTEAEVGRVADASERMEDDLKESVQYQGQLAAQTGELVNQGERSLAFQAAMAKKQGVSHQAGLFQPGRALMAVKASVISTVLGEDDVRRAQRRSEALK